MRVPPGRYYCHPSEAEAHFSTWVDTVHGWLLGLGLKEGEMRCEAHVPEDLAHYALQTTDIEFNFPFGLSLIHI